MFCPKADSVHKSVKFEPQIATSSSKRQNRYAILVNFEKSQIFMGIEKKAEIFTVDSILNLVSNAINGTKF